MIFSDSQAPRNGRDASCCAVSHEYLFLLVFLLLLKFLSFYCTQLRENLHLVRNCVLVLFGIKIYVKQ